MKKKIFIVAAVLFSSQLYAQRDTSAKILDEVLLTTNKFPKKESETGKVVTVINRQQLEKSEGKTLGEVLNTVAGVTIPGANNNYGANMTVNIRGASAGNALILIDGIPLNDPSAIDNYFDLNFFSVDQIERIEILKGGQSTLYGSDAVAGVINIITKKPDLKKFVVNGSATAGSYNTFKQYAGISGRNKILNYTFGYTHLSSDGFSSAYDSTGKQNFDKDGFNQHSLNGSIVFRLSKNLHAKIFGSYNYYKTALEAGAFTDDTDYSVKNNNIQSGGGLIYDHKKGSLHFNYTFNYVSRDYLDDSTINSNLNDDYINATYIGRTHFAELYNNWNYNSWQLLAGIDYRLNNTFQKYFSTGIYGPYASPVLNKEMSQLSPYATIIYKKDNAFNVEFGGRWNHHSEYGNNFTYSINPFYLLNHKEKIFVNLYSAFKSPTLYQLFDSLDGGNKNLKPEKGIIGEAGTEVFLIKNFRLRFVGFYRNTKNAILYTYNPFNYSNLYLNVSRQENYGVEWESNYTIGKWNFSGNYTFTDGKTISAYDGTGTPISKDTSYYNLYRIPKNDFNLNIGWQVNNDFYISGQLHSVSKREEYIFGSNPETLKGYTIINIYTEFKFSKKFKAFIDLKNITNQKYFDILGYNSKRFNFTSGLNFNLY